MPLTLAGTYSTGFAVSRKIGVESLAEYGKWLQEARPEDARFGTTSLQSFTHFFGLMVGKALGRPLEAVYFKGASPRLRILVSSGGQRSRGPRPTFPPWSSSAAPRWSCKTGTASSGLPVCRLKWRQPGSVNCAPTIDARDTTELLTQLGLDVETSTGEQCAKQLAADMVRWQTTLDSLGLKATN